MFGLVNRDELNQMTATQREIMIELSMRKKKYMESMQSNAFGNAFGNSD